MFSKVKEQLDTNDKVIFDTSFSKQTLRQMIRANKSNSKIYFEKLKVL